LSDSCIDDSERIDSFGLVLCAPAILAIAKKMKFGESLHAGDIMDDGQYSRRMPRGKVSAFELYYLLINAETSSMLSSEA
jgi:hypothetical protein